MNNKLLLTTAAFFFLFSGQSKPPLPHIKVKGPSTSELVKKGMERIPSGEHLTKKKVRSAGRTLSKWSKRKRTYFVIEEEGGELGLPSTCQPVKGKISRGKLILNVFEEKEDACVYSQELSLSTGNSTINDAAGSCEDGAGMAMGGGQSVSYKLINATKSSAKFATGASIGLTCKTSSWAVNCPDGTQTQCDVKQIQVKEIQVGSNHLVGHSGSLASSKKPASCTATCSPEACAPALKRVKKHAKGLFFEKDDPQLAVFKSQKACTAWKTSREKKQVSVPKQER